MSRYGTRRQYRHNSETPLGLQKSFSIERPIADDQSYRFTKIRELIGSQASRYSEAVPAPSKLVIFTESDVSKLFQRSGRLKRIGITRFMDDLSYELDRKSAGQGIRLWTQGLEISEDIAADQPWYDLSLQLEAGKILHEQDIILGAIRRIGDMQGGPLPSRTRNLALGQFSRPPKIELLEQIRDNTPAKLHLAAAQLVASEITPYPVTIA